MRPLLLSINENLDTSKEQINNDLLLNEADKTEETTADPSTTGDIDTDNPLGHIDDIDPNADEAKSDDTSTFSNIDPEMDGDNAFADDGSMDDGSADDGSGGLGDPNADTNMMPDTSDDSKKIIIFKDYKTLYELVNTLIEKVGNYKEIIESEDDIKKKNFDTLDFIEDSLNELKGNIKIMLTDKIKTLDYEKCKTIFTHAKGEIDLIVKLFSRISSKK